MKANRKFRSSDEAVSPVIAVILMVAITVVLAATVYVWVSGFGQSGSQSKTLAASPSTSGLITISSVSPSFNWASLKITVDGDTAYGIYANGKYVRDAAWTNTAATGTLAAGDSLKVGHRTSGSSITVNFIDTAANTVVASITVPVAADTTAPTVTATKADPTVATFSEGAYLTDATITASNSLFAIDNSGTTAGVPTIAATAITTWSQGTSIAGVDLSAAPETNDKLQAHATNKWYDLAGNAWSADYTYP